MHVVMTRTRKNQFHFGLDIITVVDDNIEDLKTTNEIKARLLDKLDADFKLWDERNIPSPGLNRDRYENFIMGYIYRHDLLKDEPDHSVYFRWDGSQVRVFVHPLKVEYVSTLETKPPESLIADAGAATSDPPPVGTPPPPLQGSGASKR